MTKKDLEHYSVILAAALIAKGSHTNKYQLAHEAVELVKLIEEEAAKV